MNPRKRLSLLLRRDEYLCGPHLGGCGKRIPTRAEATVDHIFTKSFFKDREDGIRRKDYNQNWNLQPMHEQCNYGRGGQIHGFPLFTCSCHWLQIRRTSEGHVLNLHYRRGRGEDVFPVSSEGHSFVMRNISTGEFASEFGGQSEIEVAGVWSMGGSHLKSGEKGITGKGHLGHVFPRISPEEVQQFNRLEIQRIRGGSSQTIGMFNRRLDSVSIQVHWTRANDSPA